MAKTKKQRRFYEFPTQVFVHHVEDSDGGYFLVTDSEIDAVEQAESENSQVATYELISQASLGIVKTVTEID